MIRARTLLIPLLTLLASGSGAATLSGTCKVTGNSFSSPYGYCEQTFAFSSVELSDADCQLYKAQMDGEACRAVAPSGACNFTAGYLLSANCSGGGSGSGSWFGGSAFSLEPFARLNPFGPEEGEAFYSGHYGSGLEDWRDDALERWRAYLARNALAKETGVFIGPDNPFARSLEWLYRALAGSKQPAAQVAGTFTNLDSSPETASSARYQEDFVGKTVPLLRGEDASGPADGGFSAVSGNNHVAAHCQSEPALSIPPSFGVSYDSLYGGRSETIGLALERFPDGRAVFTDGSNTRWTFRPYGKLSPKKGDNYYRPPLGSPYRLLLGKRGYRVETPDGDVIEFSPAPGEERWRPSRYNAADGSWLTYAYGPNGLARITDMHGRYYAFERDAKGLPLSVTDQSGRKTVFAYDAQGRTTEVASPDGFEKRFDYNAAGQLTAVKSGSLAEEQFTYDASGRVLTSEAAGGVNRLEHYYNDAASKTVITDGLGSRTEYSYVNEYGRKLTTGITDALGGRVSLSYDPNYNLASATDQLGRTVKYIRNSNGDPEVITDAIGSTSTIQYQVKRKYHDAAGEHADYYSRPIRIADALGRVTSLGYDKYGNLAKTVDALGNGTEMDYDKAGHMLSLRDAMGATYSYEYGRGLSRSVDPLGRATRYQRDAEGRVALLTDPLGRNTSFTYDLSGNVTSVTNPQNFVTRFAYGDGACPSCAGGQLSALTDPKGNTWAFNYDQYGRLSDTANPLGQKKTYQYDMMSRVTEVRDPAENLTTYAYDSMGRLTKKDIESPSGGHAVTTYVYDKTGNLLNAANGNGMVSFTYDALNRPVKTEQLFAGRSYAIAYAYDAVGNRTSMTTPWGKYTYTYDALNRQTGIVNPQGINVSFGYDAVGRRTSKKIFKTTPELLAETSYSYDAAGQLLNITNKAGGKVVAFTNYQYDAAGNRVKKEDRDGTTQYRYDASNRLITAEPVPMKMEDAEVFIYDRNGNRRYDKGAWDYKYDAANRLLENSTYTYTHDLNGNLTGRADKRDNSTITYVYNPEQQLSEVITPEHKVQYKYDPLGRRLEKSVDGNIVRFFSDGQDIIADLNAAGNPINIYINGPGIDEPLVMTKPDGKSYYYHADALGSVIAIADDSNQIVETYSYKAYGQPTIKDVQGQTIESSTIGNTRMFAAREYESESGLYSNRHRYLDPGRGAFTQEDSIGFVGGNSNLYVYAKNLPSKYSDSTGYILEEAKLWWKGFGWHTHQEIIDIYAKDFNLANARFVFYKPDLQAEGHTYYKYGVTGVAISEVAFTNPGWLKSTIGHEAQHVQDIEAIKAHKMGGAEAEVRAYGWELTAGYIKTDSDDILSVLEQYQKNYSLLSPELKKKYSRCPGN